MATLLANVASRSESMSIPNREQAYSCLHSCLTIARGDGQWDGQSLWWQKTGECHGFRCMGEGSCSDKWMAPKIDSGSCEIENSKRCADNGYDFWNCEGSSWPFNDHTHRTGTINGHWYYAGVCEKGCRQTQPGERELCRGALGCPKDAVCYI
ncbi:hypothetical protein P389DRAFT_189899 [Cystobasidium minutum MCA 4210]|uniref:uncharacterized protein n=1 Tax=Cystobasidium minutum MCA 4210 TaxID=1397322 RepID=UPI0034CE4EC8|eukprot:jgi/Rhomi1/189899/estExt_fgenesh1_pg.C_4_t20037